MNDDRPVVANLDFETVKSDIIQYFQSKEELKDYNFTGSALNMLIDILSYNTHYYSLASNFLLNESFMDTAVLRQNVVSIAKRMNYIPRSMRASNTQITVQVTKTAEQGTSQTRLIPAGTEFTATSGNESLAFYNVEDQTVQFSSTSAPGTTGTVTFSIYEGTYATQRFVSQKNYKDFAYFDLGQNNIDTSTISLSVNGNAYKIVEPASETLFELNPNSNVFFLEENREGNYNIIFGDGVAGKPLNSGDNILVTYIATSGAAGNGVSSFTAPTDMTITNVSGSTNGGGARESTQSIKDNAPKWFQAQSRCVTTNDYEVFLKNNYADIQSISVYGGEEVGYPGKVFICVKPKSGESLSPSTKEYLKQNIVSRSNLVTVRPDFVDPKIFRLSLNTVVVFDKNRLATNRDILKTKIKSLYEVINSSLIGNFKDSFRESNLSYEIRKIDDSVVSSNTRVVMTAKVVATGQKLSQYKYAFNNKVYHPFDGFLQGDTGVFSSSLFPRVGKTFLSGFDDDGYGNVRLFDFIDSKKVYLNRQAGRIDYENGIVEFLYDFDPADGDFTISIIPDSVDIIATQDMILEIDIGNSTVDAVEINETDILKAINLSKTF